MISKTKTRQAHGVLVAITSLNTAVADVSWLQGNSKFRHLCHSQLKLVSTVLQKADGQADCVIDGNVDGQHHCNCCLTLCVNSTGGYGTRLTVYRREASSFEAGQLQLSKISTFTDPGEAVTESRL